MVSERSTQQTATGTLSTLGLCDKRCRTLLTKQQMHVELARESQASMRELEERLAVARQGCYVAKKEYEAICDFCDSNEWVTAEDHEMFYQMKDYYRAISEEAMNDVAKLGTEIRSIRNTIEYHLCAAEYIDTELAEMWQLAQDKSGEPSLWKRIRKVFK